MTNRELFEIYYSEFQQIYSDAEARSCVNILLEDIYHITKRDMIVSPSDTIDVEHSEIQVIIDKIRLNTPVQYIANNCYFMEQNFFVDSGVLIPRPETEQLVNLIIGQNSSAISILDIGTGSGAIAVSLSKFLPNCEVIGYDISSRALEIAEVNNRKISSGKVIFERVDILSIGVLPKTFDVIVSNPPYVRESEKIAMRENVLNHEPHLALFVSDSDPLIFYRKISQLAFNSLNEKGKVYFEINEAFSKEVELMMSEIGFEEIEVVNDMFDKPRIIVAIR